jgi:hypothetical protein
MITRLYFPSPQNAFYLSTCIPFPELLQPSWKSIWWFFRKLEMVLPDVPAILLLGIYPKVAPPNHKDTCSTMFITALFIIARNWKQPRCVSTKKKKMDPKKYVSFTQWNTIQLLKPEHHEFCRQMDGSRNYHFE